MLAEEIASFILHTGYDNLPAATVDKAKQCFLDWLGCVYAAHREDISESLIRMIEGQGGNQESTIAGYFMATSSLLAALANGTMAHAVEYDDIYKYALYHPGAPVIASSLAVAEKNGATGADLITAIVIGYEVSNRIGVAVNPSHYRYWHTTGTVGTFGAAAAAAKLLNLSAKEIINAIGNAGTQAAGLWECTGTMSKPLHAGKAAMNGLLAALLAKHGLNGPERILEGERGFLRAMSEAVSYEDIVQGLGENYTILDVTFKNYASCGHTHAPVDAALQAINNKEFRIKDIKKIIVRTYEAALRVAGNPSPRSAAEAKFSIPYCVATVLKHGKLDLEQFNENYLSDPDVRQIMYKIDLAVDDEVEKRFPGQRGAVVTIETHEKKYQGEVKARKGDPENPLSKNELITKFYQLGKKALDKSLLARQKELIMQLELIEEIPILWQGIRNGKEGGINSGFVTGIHYGEKI